MDVAGRVEAVGAGVTRFRPGDEVFGGCNGALAEYVCGCGRARGEAGRPDVRTGGGDPRRRVRRPSALRDHGRLQAGQSILVNGAAGGVGTFAVQMAKAFGAEVAGVRHRQRRPGGSLGAEQVVDYTAADFTRAAAVRPGRRRGRQSIALRPAAATAAHGTIVLVGGGGGSLLGPMTGLLWARAVGRFASQRVVTFFAGVNDADLAAIEELVEAGKVAPVVDRTYPLAQTADAIRHLEAGHARGKVVVTV